MTKAAYRLRLQQILAADNVADDRFVRYYAVLIDPETQEVLQRVPIVDLACGDCVELAIERTNHNAVKDDAKCSA